MPYPHYPPPAVAAWAGLPAGDTHPYVDPDTGRRVIAFMSAMHQSPDLTAELFVLEPPAAGRRVTA